VNQNIELINIIFYAIMYQHNTIIFYYQVFFINLSITYLDAIKCIVSDWLITTTVKKSLLHLNYLYYFHALNNFNSKTVKKNII